jgi:antitoxin (DNA-binding transcriptional repressor) of toxin-antitoxin stability system
MVDNHAAEEDLVMFYYRESGLMQKGSLDDLQKHLENCPACNTAYRNLVRVLDACDDLPVPEPHPAFESRIWNRLEPQLHPLHQRAWWGFLETRWFAAAAVAAMLVVAFLAGRFTRKPNAPVAQIVAITADGRQRVLQMALGEHLERSQMVLTELANGSDQTSEMSIDRERARDLINENRLYRQTAAETGDPAIAQTLDQLERVLLDISHGTDPGEIKSRIDSESLLFKLRVLGSNLKRSDSSVPKPAQETL